MDYHLVVDLEQKIIQLNENNLSCQSSAQLKVENGNCHLIKIKKYCLAFNVQFVGKLYQFLIL